MHPYRNWPCPTVALDPSFEISLGTAIVPILLGTANQAQYENTSCPIVMLHLPRSLLVHEVLKDSTVSMTRFFEFIVVRLVIRLQIH
jgi:hypothetical protein